jgi:hypothetical protein
MLIVTGYSPFGKAGAVAVRSFIHPEKMRGVYVEV